MREALAPLNWKAVTWALGLFGAVTFVICVVYGLLVPRALHMVQLLEIALPGFKWLSLGSVVLGASVCFRSDARGAGAIGGAEL